MTIFLRRIVFGLMLGMLLIPLLSFGSPRNSQVAGRALSLLAKPKIVEGASAKLWSGSTVADLEAAIQDGDEKTWVVLTPESRDSQLGVGLQWSSPERINGLRVAYATLNGSAYEAVPDFQSLEVWDGDRWRSLDYKIRIDYSQGGEFAPYQKSGLVSWDYNFDSVVAHGIRLLLHRASSPVRWDQRYVIREMQAYFSAVEARQLPKVVVVGRPSEGEQDEASVNWSSSEAGAVQSQDEKGMVISWPRPRMVNELILPLKELPGPLQWWDGQEWEDIEISQLHTGSSDEPSLKVLFSPVAIRKMRLVGLNASPHSQVRLGRSASEYFDRVYQSGRDLLMERILNHEEEPDFASVASLLLPLDMQTSVIGRPGDSVECMVHWNGTVVEIENGDKGAWNSGAKERVPGKEQWIDRWFAFAADGELFGEDPDRTSGAYLDGFMPAVLTRYAKEGVQFEQEIFTSAPGDSLYAQVVTLRVSNPGNTTRKTGFSVILGRRKSAEAGHHRGPGGVSPGPMSFAPLETGYRTEPGSKAVRNQTGEIILYADTPFQWGGTPQENTLLYPLQLNAGQVKEFHFILPSVNAPVKDLLKVERVKVNESREQFRSYWRQLLEGKGRLDLPEQPLNDLYKSLLAQAMIILRDDDRLKYGAYWYESYFGVEEGWPLVALAQFGHGDQARQGIEVMLSPELMDKSNYHHQYRSGLEPMYTAQVYRLVRDRQWLRTIKPRLVETAEWIMDARHRTEGKKKEFHGLLPKHAYGGDIHTPAYSLYSNATCWRGLQDIGLLMEELGDHDLGKKYLREAEEYRRSIGQIVLKTTNQEVSPPFVPLSLDIGAEDNKDFKKVETPYPFIPSDPLGNYWILFAPLLLETGVFPADSLPARWITSYMEQHGGLLAGLARFYRGVDHIYGFGYPLQLYERGERKKFLASVYSVLAHGCARDNFTSPEVAGVFPLRTENLISRLAFGKYIWNWDLYSRGWMQEGFGVSIGSEPLSAGSGMALQLIRKMVINEELDADSKPTGTLDLLKMAPAAWLKDGKNIRVERMPTFFGEVDLAVRSQLAEKRISGRFNLPAAGSVKKAMLWLRHPDNLPIRGVRVNGRGWTEFTAESVALPSGAGEFEVEF